MGDLEKRIDVFLMPRTFGDFERLDVSCAAIVEAAGAAAVADVGVDDSVHEDVDTDFSSSHGREGFKDDDDTDADAATHTGEMAELAMASCMMGSCENLSQPPPELLRLFFFFAPEFSAAGPQAAGNGLLLAVKFPELAGVRMDDRRPVFACNILMQELSLNL